MTGMMAKQERTEDPGGELDQGQACAAAPQNGGIAPPEARERVSAMAQRFGLSLLEIESYADLAPRLESICEGCTESGACRRAMAGEAPFPIAVCPNAGVYAVLAAE